MQIAEHYTIRRGLRNSAPAPDDAVMTATETDQAPVPVRRIVADLRVRQIPSTGIAHDRLPAPQARPARRRLIGGRRAVSA